MSPTTFDSFAEWMAWAFSPEHIVISLVGAAIGIGTLIALGFVIERLWRRANERVDDAAEPATASRTDWWLCPVCNSLNRPSQHCYKGCATVDGQVHVSRGDVRPGVRATSAAESAQATGKLSRLRLRRIAARLIDQPRRPRR